MRGRVRIGLEVHVQLDTVTKLFCADLAAAGSDPNTRVCPVCLGLPGALPVVNERAVELAVRTALGLGCSIHEWSEFARKSYFYPDLPRGYQITQAAHPLATGGSFGGVRIRRVHLEEDAGRLLHDRFAGRIAIDLNRAGVPLVEIVTEPDIESPGAAREVLVRLRRLLLFLGVSDCEMESGSLRVDANVSAGDDDDPGPVTELKNLNSFAHVEHALRHEIGRLQGHASDGAVSQTRGWDERLKRTVPLRAKEDRRDYRYQREPDLPPLRVDRALVERIAAAMPESPDAVAARFAAVYDLPPAHVEVLTADPALSAYFDELATRCGAGAASSWVLTDVLGWLNRHGLRVDSMPVAPAALAELIELEHAGRVSRRGARRAFEIMAEDGRNADEVVAAHDLAQVGADDAILEWVESVIAAFPDEVARCRKGESKLMAFLMGQLMRESGGRADPKRAGELLRRRIGP